VITKCNKKWKLAHDRMVHPSLDIAWMSIRKNCNEVAVDMLVLATYL